MTRPVRTEGDAAAGARHRPPPPTPGEIEKKTRRSDDDARGGGMTFAAAPSISPREATALRRHIRGARGLRVGEDDGIAPPAAEDGVGGAGEGGGGTIVGSSPPALRPLATTPSPREARAYEKHVIRGMRERLDADGGPRAKEAESAYDRHVGRIQGRPRTA